MATVVGVVSWLVWTPLALLTLSKALSLTNAIRWLAQSGAAYRRLERRRERHGRTILPPWRWRALDRTGGNFPPFGVTDYLLDRLAGTHRWARGMRWIHRGDRIAFFVVFFGYALTWLAPGTAPLWIGLAVAQTVLVLLLGIEAALSFAQLGSYLIAFHHESRGRRKTARTQELAFLGRIIARAIGTSWIAVYLSATYGGGFEKIAGDPMAALYYVVVTTLSTVGYGDLGPTSTMGQALATVVMAQSATIFVVVASGVMSVSSDA